jgi:hypothetical protein
MNCAKNLITSAYIMVLIRGSILPYLRYSTDPKRRAPQRLNRTAVKPYPLFSSSTAESAKAIGIIESPRVEITIDDKKITSCLLYLAIFNTSNIFLDIKF